MNVSAQGVSLLYFLSRTALCLITDDLISVSALWCLPITSLMVSFFSEPPFVPLYQPCHLKRCTKTKQPGRLRLSLTGPASFNLWMTPLD